MNKSEYRAFEKAVSRFFEEEGINCLSSTEGEPSFSSSRCECCGTKLGGDRWLASGYSPEAREVYEYSVCSDCLDYVEYGQLDDMTMLDMD